jgi:zinc/manganese transport system permease protein
MLELIATLVRSFPYAVATGLLVGMTCALLGVFVILKRVVFIGIALSEIAACGIAGSLMVGLPPLAGALVLTLAAVTILAIPFESRRIPRDALLGVLFVAASSLSVLLVSRSGLGLHEVKALLHGDLILTSRGDFLVLCAILVPSAACLLGFLRPMLCAFLDREAATVLRVCPARWELLFFLLLGVVVAAASKTAGALLVFCYLVVPSTAALLLTRRLGRVLVLAATFAALITLVGLAVSFAADLPTNQTICVTACSLLLLLGLVAVIRHLVRSTLESWGRE